MIQGNRTPVGEDSAASELPNQPWGQAGGLRGPPRSPLRHRLLCNWGAVLVDRLGSWGWSSVGSTTAMATLVEKPPSGQASHQQHCHLLSLADGSLCDRDCGRIQGYTVVSSSHSSEGWAMFFSKGHRKKAGQSPATSGDHLIF